MSLHPQTRNYHMSDGDLKQEADTLISNINRDLADLAARNVNATTVAGFRTMVSDFDNCTTDEELLGELNAATDIKNGFVNSIEVAIRPIRNMAEIVYHSKGKYNSFGFTDMVNMKESDLYKLAKRVVRVGTKLMADLAPQGLTAAMLTNLGTLATNFDNAIDTEEDKKENRDLETQNRIVKGNAVYAKMMELASIGKSIYADTNEAKYNDYVLIGGSGGTPPPAKPAV